MAIILFFCANITTTERIFCALPDKKLRKSYFCTVERSQIISAFAALGEILEALAKDQPRPLTCTEAEWEALQQLIEREQHHNGWFTPDAIKMAFQEIAPWLSNVQLNNWLATYSYAEVPKTIALILPGNLPLVGFHDFLCVLCAGHKALVKLSSEDARLLPALAKLLVLFEPELQARIEFVVGGFTAVIATGSNNSMLHFKQYFEAYPCLLRGHRTSVAILDGTETSAELEALGQDIFQYFGRGCRNVTQLLIAHDYDLNRFFEAIIPYADVIHHKKYGNNYDYNKAIHLMNQVPILDNNFVLLKESSELHSPLGMLHYHRYQSREEVLDFIKAQQQVIQCVVGHGYLPFGSAQCPKLTDYADGIDTMQFLGNFATCLS
ncbi:MAG: hypothetical protein RL098_652 [Bacteroidota bacterium]